MNLQKVTNVYVLLSIVLVLCFPFTGIIALVYAVRSRNEVRSGGNDHYIAELLDNCDKWIITTVRIFVVVYILLLLFFTILPQL